MVYLPVLYFLFPETKRRTLEEIGEIFGDKNVAAHWYGISDEEKRKIAHDAMKLTDDGRIPDNVPVGVKPPGSEYDDNVEKVDDEKHENSV